jgi:hypothetical protein
LQISIFIRRYKKSLAGGKYAAETIKSGNAAKELKISDATPPKKNTDPTDHRTGCSGFFGFRSDGCLFSYQIIVAQNQE